MTDERNMNDEPVIIPLELENGATVDCHVIAVFDFDGIDYIAVLPEGTEEILMYRYIEFAEDEIELVNIDNDREWERVVEYFDTMLEAEEEEE